MYVAQCCSKPVTLYSDQKGLKMIKVGLQWFFNQTGDYMKEVLINLILNFSNTLSLFFVMLLQKLRVFL